MQRRNDIHAIQWPVLLLLSFVTAVLPLAGCAHNTPAQPPVTQNVSPTTPPPTTTPVNVTTPPASTTTPPASTTTPPAGTTPPVTINNLGKLQANGFVSARFFGIVTLHFSGTPVTYPTEFAMPKVPITWTGTSFKGQLEEVGNGEDVLYQAAGNASSDGSKLVSFVFSQTITRTAGDGTFYRLTVDNLPVGSTFNASQQGWGTFKGIGADLQNYITRIEYAAGPLAGGNITPQTTYDSTDWLNQTQPTLSVEFQSGVNAISLTPTFAVASMSPAAPSWGTADKATYALVTASTWKNFYAAAPQGADFANNIYVVASIGAKPNAGYTVSIPYVQQIGDEITVKVHLGLPDPNMVYAQVVTYPVAVVQINKTDIGAFSNLTTIFVDDAGNQIAVVHGSP